MLKKMLCNWSVQNSGKALKVLVIMFSMVLTATAGADDDNYVMLENGEEVLLIEVEPKDVSESMNNRNNVNMHLRRRVNNLEQAVRALQKRVYQLEDVEVQPPKPRPNKNYTCEFRSCRQSTSVHYANSHNCRFFKMWRDDSIRVWARNAESAENIVQQKIKDTQDIVLYNSNSISCKR